MAVRAALQTYLLAYKAWNESKCEKGTSKRTKIIAALAAAYTKAQPFSVQERNYICKNLFR